MDHNMRWTPEAWYLDLKDRSIDSVMYDYKHVCNLQAEDIQYPNW